MSGPTSLLIFRDSNLTWRYHYFMGVRWIDLWREDDAVTALEYGLIAGLIFLVMVVSVKALGTKSSGMYNTVQSAIEGAE
jgi:pilus assembly protein Flp/PilA